MFSHKLLVSTGSPTNWLFLLLLPKIERCKNDEHPTPNNKCTLNLEL